MAATAEQQASDKILDQLHRIVGRPKLPLKWNSDMAGLLG